MIMIVFDKLSSFAYLSKDICFSHFYEVSLFIIIYLFIYMVSLWEARALLSRCQYANYANPILGHREVRSHDINNLKSFVV